VKWLRHWWWWFAALAVLVLGAYVGRFARYGLSWRTEDWARFGEYVGGVFGVLAFAAVLITVELQRRQLRQLGEQATVDELHRICREIASNIDQALDIQFPQLHQITEQEITSKGLNRSLRGVLELMKDEQLTSKPDRARFQHHRISFQRSFDIARPEFDLLANCIQDSVLRGGSVIILAYYRDRYQEIVRRLLICGFPVKTAPFWLQNIPIDRHE